MSLADDAVSRVDRNELVDLALAICNIDSGGPKESEVAKYIYKWLKEEGFKARQVGLVCDRFNIIGKLPGSRGGYSLLFNSHMDTAISYTDVLLRKDPGADLYHKAWIEGDLLVGEGIVNDKGPMAAFLIAAKAVKATGAILQGDLLLTGVVAETSGESSEEPSPGQIQETHDLGARFLVTHGGVADYALIAEGTGFSIVTVDAGMAFFKITWLCEQTGFYTPYLPDRTDMRDSPNMIVRAAVAIEALERWAAEYQRKYVYASSSGPVIPKAQITAIRSGDPTNANFSPEVCSLYLGAFTVPDQDPLQLREEIQSTLEAAGVPPTEIELYHFRRGYEARNAERLMEALLRAHLATFGTKPPPPHPATCSMFRDINIFNEVGIPAITYEVILKLVEI